MKEEQDSKLPSSLEEQERESRAIRESQKISRILEQEEHFVEVDSSSDDKTNSPFQVASNFDSIRSSMINEFSKSMIGEFTR